MHRKHWLLKYWFSSLKNILLACLYRWRCLDLVSHCQKYFSKVTASTQIQYIKQSQAWRRATQGQGSNNRLKSCFAYSFCQSVCIGVMYKNLQVVKEFFKSNGMNPNPIHRAITSMKKSHSGSKQYLHTGVELMLLVGLTLKTIGYTFTPLCPGTIFCLVRLGLARLL